MAEIFPTLRSENLEMIGHGHINTLRINEIYRFDQFSCCFFGSFIISIRWSQDKKSKCIIVSLAYKGIYIFIFLIDGSYILIFCSRIRFKSKVFLCSDLTFYRIIFRQKIIRGGILQRRISYF